MKELVQTRPQKETSRSDDWPRTECSGAVLADEIACIGGANFHEADTLIRAEEFIRTVSLHERDLPSPHPRALPKLVVLCDTNIALCDAWFRAFRGVGNIDIIYGDIFDLEADAIVSPANSFGFMDGGIDAFYLKHFGEDLQSRLQQRIKDVHGGELLVGQATEIRILGDHKVKWMISAPTMRTPQRIYDLQDVRLSTRAALQAARGHNSVILTGMGAGSGGVPPDLCAHFMWLGWRDVFDPQPFPRSWLEAASVPDPLP